MQNSFNALPAHDLGNDQDLNADQLDHKYNPEGDGEHPTYTRAMWREAVASENTLSGYWQWVVHEIDVANNDGGIR
ncbi:hypothetical protein [Azotobacter chroococcum]|uniref:hypothetical protein n=1 Tax=Azotobacter chroococcum TaxID=353 RepID=UPI0010AE08DD|nr:hypothetical protein [Azotobacter chroococcum]TKD44885.1 hypothetical protein FCG41_05310 [Azotobacter chroococcum]